MKTVKVISLSFIGGGAAGLASLILYLLGPIVKRGTLITDVIISGFVFTIVGAGIMLSFILLVPQIKRKRTKLLTGGIISGLFSGLFFYLGIGQYFSMIIFPASIAFVIRILDLPGALRILAGGILGGFASVSLSVIFFIGWSHFELLYPILQNQLSIIPTIMNTAIIIYFMNFGMLLGFAKAEEDK